MSNQKPFDYESEKLKVNRYIDKEGERIRTLQNQLDTQKEKEQELDCSLLNSEINAHVEIILVAAFYLESQEELRYFHEGIKQMCQKSPEGQEKEFFQKLESRLEREMFETAIRFRQRIKKAERLGESP